MALLAACSATDPGSTFDASVDATDAADAPTYDFPDCGVPKPCGHEADASPLVGLVDGGGPFLCFGCPCDGKDHYCDTTSAGPPAPTDPDAGCLDAKRCKPYPSVCEKAPICLCLLSTLDGGTCSCARAPSGDGLLAGCKNY